MLAFFLAGVFLVIIASITGWIERRRSDEEWRRLWTTRR